MLRNIFVSQITFNLLAASLSPIVSVLVPSINNTNHWKGHRAENLVTNIKTKCLACKFDEKVPQKNWQLPITICLVHLDSNKTTFAIERSDLMETAATAPGNSRPLVFAWLSHDSFTMKKCVAVVLFAILVGVISTEADSKEEEKRAREFLEKLNERTAKRNNRVALAKWAYATNITDANLQQQVSWYLLLNL